MTIGFVLFPNLTQLDLTGPYEVFARVPQAKVLLIAQTLAPVVSDRNLAIVPNMTFTNCPALDIICVPGGPGITEAITNDILIRFLKTQANQAQYITSVCTGALVLAAAGLLDGYKATTHWLSIDLLRMFDKIDVRQDRVVKDRNRITGGGVTAGIDFGLTLVAELFGKTLAQDIQLTIEYDPRPPFDSGLPHKAPVEILEAVLDRTKDAQNIRKQKIRDFLKQ